MTREEMIAAVNRKRMIEAVEAKRAGEGPEEYEATLGDRVDALIGQGAMMGFGDEVMSAGEAAFTDTTYREGMDRRKAERERYEEAYPIESLALNIGGGFATGAVGGAKMMGMKALSKMGKVKKLAGIGALEGAVAGAGGADTLEDVPERAAMGGTLGAAVPLALHGGGNVLRKASDKFKLANKLPVHADGTQMPITMADPDGWRGAAYRDVVGEAFGGGRLAKQAAPFLDDATKHVEGAASRLRYVGDAGKHIVKKAERRVRDDAQKAVADLDTSFRSEVLQGSLPANVSDAVRKGLAGKSPQEATKLLSSEWVDKGFDVVTKRGKHFAFDDVIFKNRFKGLFKGSPSLRNAAGEYFDDFAEEFDRVYNPNTGTMKGADLMELRNAYARDANSTSDPIQRKIFSTIKRKFDDIIEDNLSSADKVKYKADKDAWDMFSNMRKATGKASNRKSGDFTADEWLSSTQNSRLATGSGPQQELAQNVQSKIKVIKQSIQQKIKDLPEKAEAGLAKTNATTGLKKARDDAARLRKLGPKPSNLFRKVVATSVLGGPLAAATSNPLGLTAGAGVARALSSPTAQRMVAGQSLDELLNKAGQHTMGGLKTSDLLRQGASGGAQAWENWRQE